MKNSTLKISTDYKSLNLIIKINKELLLI